ncbi:MAG: cytochrome c oxidase subunit 3 [Bacteroidota bacterium]
MRISGATETNPTFLGKTAMFFLMISVIILFGTLTLAFIITPTHIDKGFHVPAIFYLNTLFLIGSSVLLHLGYINRKTKPARSMIRPAIWLGVLFLVFQVYGWYELFQSHGFASKGAEFANPKMDYLYLLTGLHGLHLVGGLIFLAVVSRGYEGKSRKYFEMAVYFWHFLGILWVYLLGVLISNS